MPKVIDLSSYHPNSPKQAAFHASQCPHRLLIGGMGSGKTYPAIHESLFHALQNPGHNFGVFKNTWDHLEKSIQGEFLDICYAYGLVESFNKDEHKLVLPNRCNIYFLPMTLTEQQMKGFNFCGMLFDDIDVWKYWKMMAFMYSRLRNRGLAKAESFRTIVTANWEGIDWVVEKFMIRNNVFKKEGEWGGVNDVREKDIFTYWMMRTEDNEDLPPEYISTLKTLHSEDWMDRYINMENLQKHSGITGKKII